MVRAGIPEGVAMTIIRHKTRLVLDRRHLVSKGDLREAARKPPVPATRMGTVGGTIAGDVIP
jgi:hypothetical protein